MKLPGFHTNADDGQESIVVTFDSTANAFALKALAAPFGLEGRLAPIPRSLSADCGISWLEPTTNEEQLLRAIRSGGVEYREIRRFP